MDGGFILEHRPARSFRPRPVARAVLPPGTRVYPLQRCEETTCRRWMQRVQDGQRFCCPPCKRKWHRRKEERGAAAYEALLDFAHRRKKRGEAMTQISRLGAEWKAEDKAAIAAAEARHPRTGEPA